MMHENTIRLFSRSWSACIVPVLNVGIGQRLDERKQELVLVADRLHLVIRVEDLRLVEAEASTMYWYACVWIASSNAWRSRYCRHSGAEMWRYVPSTMLFAGEAVGGDEEAEVALDDQPLVVGEPVRILPQLDVALHVDFLRHPVVRAAGQVLVPRPLVFERHELVDVGLAVDDALVLDAARALNPFCHRLLLGVEIVHRLARPDASSTAIRRFALGRAPGGAGGAFCGRRR